MTKKSFYQGYLKKVLGIVIIAVMFFSTISNVYAKTLTINEISNQFEQTKLFDVFNINLSTKVNTDDNTLDIYGDDEKIFSFTYGTDYIEYDDRSTEVTMENAINIGTDLCLKGMIESILKLSGYDDQFIELDEDYTDTYDTYGIQMETEHYDFSIEEDGISISMTGEFVKYFKMSFDTDKIDALMNKYGVDIDEQNPNTEIFESLIPTIEAKDITENSVTLYPHVNYTNTDLNYTINCYIYRSTSIDGDYEKISDAVNCFNPEGFKDENLNSNTTYYYKSLVVGGTKYSEPLKVTTKEVREVNTDNLDVSEENPPTGMSFPIITASIITVVSIVILKVIHKKSAFKRI